MPTPSSTAAVDAIMLENFSDWPQYSTEIPLEAYSLMVSIATRIREFCKIPFGVNIEMNAFVQEWAMAYAVDADFIRFEAYVDNRAGSFGYIEACSTPLAKIRQDYPSDTMIFADVHTAETYGVPNVAINELAGNAKGHDADAVIVTENDLNKKITPGGRQVHARRDGRFPHHRRRRREAEQRSGLHGVLRCRYRRPRLQDRRPR